MTSSGVQVSFKHVIEYVECAGEITTLRVYCDEGIGDRDGRSGGCNW